MNETKMLNIDSLLKVQLSRSVANGASEGAIASQLRDYLQLERQEKGVRYKKLPLFGCIRLLSDQNEVLE